MGKRMCLCLCNVYIRALACIRPFLFSFVYDSFKSQSINLCTMNAFNSAALFQFVDWFPLKNLYTEIFHLFVTLKRKSALWVYFGNEWKRHNNKKVRLAQNSNESRFQLDECACALNVSITHFYGCLRTPYLTFVRWERTDLFALTSIRKVSRIPNQC